MPDKAPPPPRPPRGFGREPDSPAHGTVRNGELPGSREDAFDLRNMPVPSPPPPEDPTGEKPTNGNVHQEHPTHPGVPLSPPGIVPESDVRTHSPAAAVPPREHSVVEELGELPWFYGDGRLVCLVRDPTTIYVYWDLSQQQIEQAFGGLGSARASLRIFNASRGDMVRTVEVHLEARGWYVRELPSALELRVELWAEGEKGARLLRAARPVRLPPAQPSDILEEFYATLPLGHALRGDPITGGRPLAWKSGAAPPGWERRMQPRWQFTSSRPGAAGAGGEKSGLPWSGTVQKTPEDDENR
ncbi:MAG: DUF4912 domain-containing protein [Myxococcales bacterium]